MVRPLDEGSLARCGHAHEIFGIDDVLRRHAERLASAGYIVFAPVGFCVGGGFALLLSANGFDASAVNYGTIPDDIDDIASRACPIVASYGGKDRMSNDVPALRAALQAHAVPNDVEVYPSAGHCFLNDEINGPTMLRPVARRLQRFTHVGPEPAAAADAWRRIEAFFRGVPALAGDVLAQKAPDRERDEHDRITD